MRPKIHYDVHDNGLDFRPDNGEIISLNWNDILYIEDRSGHRLDIFSNNQGPVPVRYVTNGFCLLLETICLKLSEIRKESFSPQIFSLTFKHLLHLIFVISVLVISLLGSFWAGNALFITLLIMFFPLGIILQRQPISLTIGNHHLTVRYLFTKRHINYSEIQNIKFEIKTNDYGSTLCIMVNLKNSMKMTLQKFENLILFFIMLQIKLNEHHRTSGRKEELNKSI